MPTTQPSTVDAESLAELITDGCDPIDVSADDLPDFLGEVLVDDYDYDDEEGEASVSLIVAGEPTLSIPGSAGVTLILGEPGTGETTVDATLIVDAEWELTIESIQLTARVDGDVLRPAPEEDGTRPDHLDVTTSVDVVVDHAWSVDVNGFEGVDLPPAEIGHTGVVIEATDVVLDVSPTELSPAIAEHDDFDDSSVDDGFVGLFVGDASVSFPDRWPLSGDLVLTGTAVGAGGLSGTIGYEPDVSFDPDAETYAGEGAGSLGDLEFAVTAVDVEFVQTALSTCSIAGELFVPYFDERVVVDLAFDMDGTLTARLVGVPESITDASVGEAADEELVSLEVPGVAAFDVDSFGLAIEGGAGGVGVSVAGTLRPLVGEGDSQPDDLDLPTIEVPEITVSSDGEIDFEGSWIEPTAQRSTELHGIELEVTKLGFGTRDDGWRYVAFGGSIAIVEGIPAGASTEGLRVAWNPDGGDVEVTFDRIGVEFEVPDALAFKGEVAFDAADERYYGDIDLDLIALDTSISATLIVGRETGPDGEEFTFLGVSLDASLPAGIPLFSTGLSIYGMGGLYAHNMEPHRGDREWYALSGEADESWYHAGGEPRVDDFDAQWRPAAGAFAFGAGVTLGTSADNGFALGSDLLLVIAFPGPVIMLEGRADVLSPGADVDAEGALRTLAVLDGDAGNVTLGIDAAFTKREADVTLLDVRAGVEAHYDFTDPSAWYLNFGRREPREDRVRAEALVFTAEGYLMIDADRVATGARVGYDESFEFGPLAVSFEAWVAGHVTLSWQPTHFSGEVLLHGSVELSAFGIGASITADAALGAEAIDPFHLHGEVSVALSTPWPLPDPEASVSLEWGPVPSPPPVPAPLDGVALGHERVTTRWPLPRSESLLTPDYATAGADGDRLLGYDEDLPSPPDDATAPPEDIPVVPPDVRPELTFSKAVIDDGDVGVNASTAGPEWQLVGDPTDDGPVEARYGLQDVSLERWDDDADEWVDDGPVFGSWAPLPDTRIGAGGAPDGEGTPPTANTKLRLWSVNPYDYGRNTGGAWEEGIDRLLGTYPCYADGRCFRLAGYEVGEELTLDVTEEATITHEVDGWPAFVSNAVTGASVAPVETDEGKLEALLYPGPTEKDPDATRSMMIDLDGSHRSVEVTLVLRRDHTHLTATAYGHGVVEDADLRSVPKEVFDVRPDEDERVEKPDPVGFEKHTVTFDAVAGIDHLVLTSTGTFGIVEVCQSTVPIATLGAAGVEGPAHVRDRLDRWSDEPRVLAPNERYRLVVDTVVEARGVSGGALADFEHRWPEDGTTSDNGTMREVAYFETSGPPALADVSTPLTPGGDVEETDDGNEAEDEIDDEVRSFDTLSRYVEGSVPESVTPDGERPSTPRPVYRAYDVGVRFGEAYVETLYAMADRDLRVQLYDADDRPVRDVDGRLGSARNPWAKAGSRALERHDRTWLSRIAEECGGVDEETLPYEDVLEERDPRLVLDPDETHEVRLVPALLRETFADGHARWDVASGSGSITTDGHDELDGDAATVASTADDEATVALDDDADLGALSANDDAVWFRGDRERPDGTYRVVDVDATDGTVTVAGVPDLSADGTWRIAPERRLVLSSAVGTTATVRLEDVPGDTPPTAWDDYAVTTNLRFTGGASGTAGVVVRNAPDADRGYRFEVDADADAYRLVRLDDGGTETLASTGAPPVEDGRDVDVRVQVVDGRVDVLVDDEPTFTVDDPEPLGPGGVGVHLANVQDLVVPEVLVEGFGAGSPVAYRFPFTTSLFADFVHQIHSFPGDTFETSGDALETLPGDPVDAAEPLPDDEPDPPKEPESRAYAHLLSALTPVVRPSVDELDATWLLDGDDPAGLLVRGPEPIDWTRTTAEVTCSEASLQPEAEPDATKVTDVRYADAGTGTADGDGSVEVLFAETERPDGHVLERRLTGDAGFTPEPVGEGIDDEFVHRSVIEPYRRIPEPDPGEVVDLPTAGERFDEFVGEVLPRDFDVDPTGPIPQPDPGGPSPGPGGPLPDPDGPSPGTEGPSPDPDDPIVTPDDDVSVTGPDGPTIDDDRLSAVSDRISRAFRSRGIAVEVDPANPLAALESASVDAETVADVDLTGEEYDLIESAAAVRALGDRTASRDDHELDDGVVHDAPMPSAVASLAAAEGEARSTDPDAEWIVGDDGLSARTEGWTGLVRPVEGSPSVWETTVSPGASGTAGLLFRLHDATHYHKVAVGGGEVVLGRRTGDGGETLRRVPFEYGSDDDPLTLRVRADDTTLWVAVDDVPLFGVNDRHPDGGAAGVFTTDDGARFTSLSVHGQVADARLLVDAFEEDDPVAGDETAEEDASDEPYVSGGEDVAGWRIVDEPPYTIRHSRWRTRDGTLEQTSNLYGFVGNRFRQPGTYAVTGNEAWSDYRISVRLRSEDDDAIGVIFRYRGHEEFYRFSMDHEREYRRLTRRSGGETTVLWADDEQYELGREYLLTIDCVGDGIVGYLDGERLFSVTDPVIDAGKIGVYCRANVGARFEDVRVTAPGDGWVPYHVFESEPALPAGTRVRIADDPPSPADLPAGVLGRTRNGDASGRLPPTATTFRLRDPQGTVGHRRTVPPADAFEPCGDVQAVRSADGTGMMLFPDVDDDVRTLRLRLTYRRAIDGDVRTRNGSDDPETTAIDVRLPSTGDE